MPRIEVFNREQVLTQAMEVFWKKGYNGTSMQDLVDATGLNRSSIYNSFESKMNLYQLALKNYQANANNMFQRILLKSESSIQAIELIFNMALAEAIGDKDNKGCFNMSCKSEMANHDQSIKNWLESTQEQTLAFFQDLIKQGQEEGIINTKQSCKAYAYYIFNAFQGFRMTGLLVKDKDTLQSIIDNTMNILN